MSEPVLTANGLTVHYGARTALNGLSFDVHAGEILGLLGPNGAGKTTLIKSICAQIKPSAGTLSIKGVSIKRGAENRKQIGLVPQDIGLYPHLTARENLDVFARMLGIKSGREAAVTQALETVGLTTRAHDRVGSLSGGMKRRINYAAAILHNPPLLILDEPTAGVDHPARDTIHTVTKNLTRNGMAVILVTHELEQAERLCDRVLMLVDGNLHGLDTPQNLLASEFGEARECVLTLETIGDDDATRLAALNFTPTDAAHIWTSQIHDSSRQPLAAIEQSLSSVGIEIREITIRKPGLPSLMYKLEQQRAAS